MRFLRSSSFQAWSAAAILLGGALFALFLASRGQLEASGYSITETVLQARNWIFGGTQTFNNVNVNGSLNMGASGAAGAIGLEEASPGTDVGTLTVGTLTAARTYTFPDASGTVGLFGQPWSVPASGTNDGNVALFADQGDYTITTALGAPTGMTSGGFGSCTNAGGESYRIAITCVNLSGETALGTFALHTPSGTGKQIQNVTRPTLPSGCVLWSIGYAKNTEGFSTYRRCLTSGTIYLAAATTSASCSCQTGATVGANTTGPVSMVDMRDGEVRFTPGTPTGVAGATTAGSILTPGLTRLYWRSLSGLQLSLDGGVTLANVLTDLNGRINLEGPAGDTYLYLDPGSGQVWVYVNGAIRARVTATGVVPGDCAPDPYDVASGEQCYEATTNRTWMHDDRGIHQVGQ